MDEQEVRRKSLAFSLLKKVYEAAARRVTENASTPLSQEGHSHITESLVMWLLSDMAALYWAKQKEDDGSTTDDLIKQLDSWVFSLRADLVRKEPVDVILQMFSGLKSGKMPEGMGKPIKIGKDVN